MTALRDLRAATLADFAWRTDVDTRWADNDRYGHLNNAVYLALFDSAINRLVHDRVAPPWDLEARGVVAESGTAYFRELGYPMSLAVGLSVERLGSSSVTYRLALAERDADGPIAAAGHWVHVYVDPATGAPTAIPAALRAVLEPLVRDAPAREDPTANG
ncbi:acyl-CoA thioesterase [Agrococcus jejuensis]|uniref:Acyl-CoA thioester hydrolase n=1 Tax=Agrococcus jejuensis TaxID=399736 RepID=A0A1G8A029_9MICO|nr:thioesterase family protein [Agrococcus jejuensis]SDH14253.1 acyl-CoA thioester hydrolase [Agrococcus jejuensis]